MICAFPRLEVTGTAMRNVELVPADTLAPVLGRFAVAPDGSFATLPFDTNSLPKGVIRVRIVAYDVPAGQPGNMVVAMPARTWNVGDPSAPPCLSPGSQTAG